MNAWYVIALAAVAGIALVLRRGEQLAPGASPPAWAPWVGPDDAYLPAVEYYRAADLQEEPSDQPSEQQLSMAVQADQEAAPSILETIGETIVAKAVSTFNLWRPPAAYAPMIAAAEDASSLPRDMLARLLYQESRYRADIISGATRSPAGALGIAQFMPATARELGIDPLIPEQAIPAAARYLAQLYRQTGTWSQALAAYNWGIGNVKRKGLEVAPQETRRYYAEILGDVNSNNGTAYA